MRRLRRWCLAAIAREPREKPNGWPKRPSGIFEIEAEAAALCDGGVPGGYRQFRHVGFAKPVASGGE